MGLGRVGVRLDRLARGSSPGVAPGARRPAWRPRSWESGPRRPGSGRRPRGPSRARSPAARRPSLASARIVLCPAGGSAPAGRDWHNRRDGRTGTHEPAPAGGGRGGRLQRRALEPAGAPRGRPAPTTSRASSRSASSTTGAAPSGWRARSTRCWSTSSTATGSAAEVEGIENVPATGGALLVSNHCGALPPDAAMIGKAIKEEHPHPRPLNITVEHFFKGYPGLLDADPEDRLRGGSPGERAPAALRRGAARAGLPRGPQGHREALQEPLPAAPFRAGRLRGGGDAGEAPIVPVCVVGAEEAAPIFAHISPLQKLTGLLYVPLTPDLPALRPAGDAGLPARQVPHPLPGADRVRLATDRPGQVPGADGVHDIRARIQENLFEMLEERESVWF